jgi:cyclase
VCTFGTLMTIARTATGIATIFCLIPLAAAPAPDRPAPVKIQIADGVFLFQTAPYGPVGLDGNSIVVTSDAGVLVFDTNGTPSAAAAVLAEVRRLTDKPVRYIVNSHWHWDHCYGTEVCTQAFPDAVVIAHEKTRQMMMGPALEFNRPGLETQLPGFIQSLDKRVADERGAGRPAADLEQTLDEARFFLEQKSKAKLVFPSLTFSERMELQLGSRRVQVLNFGRAVTPGDAVLFLPAEKILISGDLLIKPVSFALSVYPTEWLRALERIDALDPSIIVPGHGDPMRDKEHLHATMAVFRELLRQGKDAKAKGLDADAAKEAIFPGLHDLMVKITGDVPAVNAAFKNQLVDWYLHRVYNELDGRLTDAIAPIPPK